jgi:hypothetical protein
MENILETAILLDAVHGAGTLDGLLAQLETTLAVWCERPLSRREHAQVARRLGSVVTALSDARARPPRRQRARRPRIAESLPLFE